MPTRPQLLNLATKMGSEAQDRFFDRFHLSPGDAPPTLAGAFCDRRWDRAWPKLRCHGAAEAEEPAYRGAWNSGFWFSGGLTIEGDTSTNLGAARAAWPDVPPRRLLALARRAAARARELEREGQRTGKPYAADQPLYGCQWEWDEHAHVPTACVYDCDQTPLAQLCESRPELN